MISFLLIFVVGFTRCCKPRPWFFPFDACTRSCSGQHIFWNGASSKCFNDDWLNQFESTVFMQKCSLNGNWTIVRLQCHHERGQRSQPVAFVSATSGRGVDMLWFHMTLSLQLCSLIYSWLMTAYDLTLSVRFTCSESSPTWSPSTLFWPGPEVLQFLLGDLGDWQLLRGFCVITPVSMSPTSTLAPEISLDQNRKSRIAFPTCQSITLNIYISLYISFQ